MLDRDLAGVLLVDRREVGEVDAVEFHLQQRGHRQLAARLGEAHDDAVDRSRAHNRRDVGDRTDDAARRGVGRWRVGIDEADNLDAHLGAPFQFAREAQRRGIGADDEKSLAPGDRPGEPDEHDPPADHQRDGNQDGDRDHAFTDDQRRKPEVERREDQRADAERLENARQQLAPIRRHAELVEVGIVQAELAHERDQQTFPDDALAVEDRPGAVADEQVRAQRHGTRDQDRLAAHQRHGAAIGPLNE